MVEALRKWRHLVIGKHFTLVTDQKSASFMLYARHINKINNDNIARWRLELTSYSCTVVHRPGIENVGPDTLTRAHCGYVQQNRAIFTLLSVILALRGWVTSFVPKIFHSLSMTYER